MPRDIYQQFTAARCTLSVSWKHLLVCLLLATVTSYLLLPVQFKT